MQLMLGGAVLSACATAPTAPPVNTRVPTVAAPTSTPARAAAPTLFPSLTPPPLENRTPEPTQTPAPRLRPLTTGGCCVQPFFSPDGAQVWYLDKPSDTQPAGVWGVPADGGGAPAFITDRLGIFSPDGALSAYPEAGLTYVERVATGERWPVPAAGRAILFAPDSAQIAWQTASSTINFDRRVVEVWAAAVDGTQSRSIARLIGGGVVDWFPDSRRLLVTGRAEAGAEPALLAVDVATGALTPLATVANVRGALLSPAGGWLAYQVTFSGDAAQDGLWILPMAGGEPRRLALFGAYRWRAEGRLLIVPLETAGGSQRLVSADAATGALTDLTDPRVTAFRIAAGDWALSPDGRRVVFVNAADDNLWLLELPDTGGPP